MQPDNKLIGANGCLYIDGAVTGKRIFMLIVNEDAVFTKLEGMSGTNFFTEYALGANTIKQGTVITAKSNESFAKITVASGSVIGYNE